MYSQAFDKSPGIIQRLDEERFRAIQFEVSSELRVSWIERLRVENYENFDWIWCYTSRQPFKTYSKQNNFRKKIKIHKNDHYDDINRKTYKVWLV